MHPMTATIEMNDRRGPVATAIARINWWSLVCSLALQGVFLAMILSLGIVSLPRRQPDVTVLQLLSTSPQPTPPAPIRTETKPDVRPEIKPDIVMPPPIVPVPSASAPVAAAIETPPAPVAKPAPAAPAADPGPMRVDNLSTNLLSGTPPAYPMSSRHKHEQGTVVLRLVISEEGRVIDVSVSKSSGFSALDDAAVSSVKKWRWSRTIRDGRSISISGLVRIPFVLKGS